MSLELVQRCQQRRLDPLQPPGVFDFSVGLIRDVKYVDDLVEMRGDLADTTESSSSKIFQRRCKKPRPVMRKDVDDGKSLGRAIIDDDAGGKVGKGLRFGSPSKTAVSLGTILRHACARTSENSIEEATSAHVPARNFAGEIAVMHAKTVDDEPIGRRANLSRDDRQPMGGQHAGRLVKAALDVVFGE